MNSEKWREVYALYETVQALPDAERAEVLAAANQDIVSEVLLLLDAAGDEEPEALTTGPARQPGDRIGRYQLAELLGRGGMGEVYAARDLELDRTLALKFLLQPAMRDPSAVKRFVREAKAASALNHPNILTVHEVID